MNKAEVFLNELERRIKNIKYVSDWQKKTADDYLMNFKRRAASITMEELATGGMNQYVQDATNWYNNWLRTEAERLQLEAFKEDIEKGRVSFDE